MVADLSYLLADQDYYVPWTATDPGRRYQAAGMLADWSRSDSDAWTHWSPAGATLPDVGWKVHVSSSLANAHLVLAVVAAACVEAGVPFKHLAGRQTFLLMHDKHASRVQGGKFCALYPPDEEAARLLMRRLSADLAGVDGPYVLTDRRFEQSNCVSYRYGAFRNRTRVDAEGGEEHLMRGPDGSWIPDQRLPRFWLPAGITDPFRKLDPPATDRSAGRRPVVLNGYRFEAVVQHSNAGGAYRFRTEDDEQVFVKEARAHTGYTADGASAADRQAAEYLVLRTLHERSPGLGPRPIELFRHWEQSYLVTEQVPGISLYHWMVTNHPCMRTGAVPAGTFAEYYRRAQALLDQLAARLDRLHELGFVFIDLSPTNVLVEDDQLRLIDFEGVQPIVHVQRLLGTPGYLHPDASRLARTDPLELDRYGLAAVALMLLYPLHESVQRYPPMLEHLLADLTELAPVPDRLWQQATRYHERPEPHPVPSAAVRADPIGSLRELAERTADALVAMAEPDHPGWVYPTIPLGHQTDARSVATGTAGVLYALHQAGRSIDPAVLQRLRDEALAAADRAAPGLLFGSAGVAIVLADLGELDAAATLLDAAAEHPVNDRSATLGGGAAGAAIGLLNQHARTGDQCWLDAADKLLSGLPDGDQLTGWLSPTNRSGLIGGRTGVALAFYRLHLQTGADEPFERGLRLLRDELEYAEALPENGLGFKATLTDRRVYPYLFVGSAGYAAVLSRYLAHRPDAEFDGVARFSAAEALERCLAACTVRFTAFPGLFSGLAGLVSTLAGAGRRLGRPELVEAAITSARGLFRYPVPHCGGLGWHGDPGQRLSGELYSGSAGVLLAVRNLTDPAPGARDCLDGLVGPIDRPAPSGADSRDR